MPQTPKPKQSLDKNRINPPHCLTVARGTLQYKYPDFAVPASVARLARTTVFTFTVTKNSVADLR